MEEIKTKLKELSKEYLSFCINDNNHKKRIILNEIELYIKIINALKSKKDDDLLDVSTFEFINNYKDLKFQLDFEKLENKRLKTVIDEYEHILKMYADKK
jgi:hypothetical protein